MLRLPHHRKAPKRKLQSERHFLMDKKHSGVKRALFLLPIFILFLFCAFVFLIRDYLVTEKDLLTDSGIIRSSFQTTYRDWDKYKGDYDRKCVEIDLIDKPYFIRLDNKKHWQPILDPKNRNKKIEVKYQARLMHDNVLVNPNQISIDGTIIFSFNERRTFIKWFSLAVSVAILVFGLLLIRVFKIYRQNMFDHDKHLWNTNKWKLIKTWVFG